MAAVKKDTFAYDPVINTDDDEAVRPASAKDEPKLLYEDRYVKVTDTDVILKAYYFPVKKASKRIPFREIERVSSSRGDCALPRRYWGIGLSNVWWACGHSRRNNVVIKKRNDWIRCGFSVENLSNFYHVLEEKGVISGDKKAH